MSFPWAKHYQPRHPVMRWIDGKLPLPRFIYNATGGGYPVPRNLNYFWNFGALNGAALLIQIVTGIVLAMHYAANTGFAFDSVVHIMRDVNSGWLIRYAHMNGASLFFISVYIHMLRGLYFGSYKAPREMAWLMGVVILLLLMATAFMGYVLPWGQMSYWGAQVITGLFGAIPLVGKPIQTWLLGGFTPDNATLNRFFALHYLLPFVIAGVATLHVWAIHIPGSNNPTGVEVGGPQDTVPFHPYYTAKDGLSLGVGMLLFAALIFFWPNALGHPDNYTQANPLQTPAHIVPEWYFWPFYAILRSFTADFILPAKLWGVLAMFSSVFLLFFLPWLDVSPVRSGHYRPLFKKFFWFGLMPSIFALGYCGGAPVEPLNLIVSQVATAYYFVHFLIILPLVARFETPLPLPTSITAAVLQAQDRRLGRGASAFRIADGNAD
ncbi:cytochrome b N-terminal domain-containing protein [Sphingomonas sp. MMSM20]|uniref:cytochrome b n=1 Tax=Sphingomonas lycopersici TaxID=2951807 RepID=UPI002238DECE|nr:cytochrome b N-terminal domain-containing protein [Sphingomonas lycopersici]MCW6528654.1 cytochrome b N-terminal domain-containing protein [Sphingomonas lycopersici]